MLRLVGLVDQWTEIQRRLPEGWGDARLRLTVDDAGDCDGAAGLLGPLNPGRRGQVLTFFAARRAAGPAPDLVRRLLARLDSHGIKAELTLVGSSESKVAAPPERRALAEAWRDELQALPDDWSDLYAELELFSSDHLERAALLLAPVNPARFDGKPAFRFRVAREFGYGASPEMAQRCLERLDAEGIRGKVQVLRALSDTQPVQTQGPVWYVGGRSV
jgi:hypothetical protein